MQRVLAKLVAAIDYLVPLLDIGVIFLVPGVVLFLFGYPPDLQLVVDAAPSGDPGGAGLCRGDRRANEFVEAAPQKAPPAVLLAWAFGFVKAVFLGFVGVVGVAPWDDVTDPWGIGALVLGALFGLASFALLRGSRAARVVLAVLTVVGGVLALSYVVVGRPARYFLSRGGAGRRGAVASVRLAIRTRLLRDLVDDVDRASRQA